MCDLWRRDDDGTDRLIAVFDIGDLLRFVRGGRDLHRYSWQMHE